MCVFITQPENSSQTSTLWLTKITNETKMKLKSAYKIKKLRKTCNVKIKAFVI